VDTLTAIIIGLIASLPGLISGIAAYRRASSEGRSSTIQDAVQLLNSYKGEREDLRNLLKEERERIANLESRLGILEVEHRECEDARRGLLERVGVLTDQLSSLGHPPP